MDDVNPYAAPQTWGAGTPPLQSQYRAWRSGNLLVVEHGSNLPDLCVKCNLPADGGRKSYNMTWYSPFAYLGLLLGLIPFVVIALIVQKKMVVEVSICQEHRRQRRNVILIAWLGTLAGIGLAVLAVVAPGNLTAVLLIGGGIVFLAALIFGVFASRIVWPSRIDKRFAWIRGAGYEYLGLLPEFPGVEAFRGR